MFNSTSRKAFKESSYVPRKRLMRAGSRQLSNDWYTTRLRHRSLHSTEVARVASRIGARSASFSRCEELRSGQLVLCCKVQLQVRTAQERKLSRAKRGEAALLNLLSSGLICFSPRGIKASRRRNESARTTKTPTYGERL